VIGGSGFYEMDGLSGVRHCDIDTPFGATSSPIVLGSLHGKQVAFLARHGVSHQILPTEIPSRANIWALKSLGVTHIISVSAVGSLKEELEPLHFVVPDQIIDRTRERPNTFFGNGIVAHIGFADPFCPDLGEQLFEAAIGAGVIAHHGGAYVCMEGPAFSTKAESLVHRSWGASIIGMTALPEAKLAREAEICYATLAAVTDYDVWHESEAAVSVDLILDRLHENTEHARQIVSAAIAALSDVRRCACAEALKNAIVTPSAAIPEGTKRDLSPVIGKYVS
jgi:5'-methylthioadenosine phosphorylase